MKIESVVATFQCSEGHEERMTYAGAEFVPPETPCPHPWPVCRKPANLIKIEPSPPFGVEVTP